MRIVVKLGTNILTDSAEKLSRPKMVDFVRQLALLRDDGHQILLVSSGAIFAGREVIGDQSHKDIPHKQMLASVGQMRLMGLYEEFFGIYDIHVAQALLTRADLEDREQYLNARNTLNGLTELGVIPIINENDVVATDEIKIGDNDNLSAKVANLVEANLLIILSDIAGLFTADPRVDSAAELIPDVSKIDEEIFALAAPSISGVGTGGMRTKIEAAQLAIQSGTEVIIADGSEEDILPRLIAQGENIGTRFHTSVSRVESRKRWILAEKPRGDLILDVGASKALRTNGKSLLPVGIVEAVGVFERGQTVRLLDSKNNVLGQGIASYSREEIGKIKGCQSDKIEMILGYEYGQCVVHRDDMVLVE